MRYKASDFYVSRIPLLPMENFFNQFNTGEHSFDRKEWMKNQFEFPPLAEALAISSWESYQALTRLKDDLDIKDNQSPSIENRRVQAVPCLVCYLHRN